MKILVLAERFPGTLHCGAELLLYRLLEGFSRNGHSVDVLAFESSPPEDEELRKRVCNFCRKVGLFMEMPKSSWISPKRWIDLFSPVTAGTLALRTPEFCEALKALAEGDSYDIAIFCALRMTDFIDRVKAKAKLAFPIDCHSLAWERAKRPNQLFNRLNWELHRCKVKYAEVRYDRFDSCVLVAEEDAVRARQISPKARIFCIPNGVDTDYFNPSASETEKATVGFIGAMSHEPNVDAVAWFAREVWPRVRSRNERAKFYIVGADPPPQVWELARNHPGIVVTGTVPDVRVYLNRLEVIVVPMQSGGGIKNKVLEALSSGRPVVANQLAVASISHLKNGENLIFSETPEQFADSILSLWNDADRRKHLGQNARNLAVQHHSWFRMQEAWEEILQTMIVVPGRSAQPNPHSLRRNS
jgi:glycosyltransferase involved in cell wall biosynthesis